MPGDLFALQRERARTGRGTPHGRPSGIAPDIDDRTHQPPRARTGHPTPFVAGSRRSTGARPGVRFVKAYGTPFRCLPAKLCGRSTLFNRATLYPGESLALMGLFLTRYTLRRPARRNTESGPNRWLIEAGSVRFMTRSFALITCGTFPPARTSDLFRSKRQHLGATGDAFFRKGADERQASSHNCSARRFCCT